MSKPKLHPDLEVLIETYGIRGTSRLLAVNVATISRVKSGDRGVGPLLAFALSEHTGKHPSVYCAALRR